MISIGLAKGLAAVGRHCPDWPYGWTQLSTMGLRRLLKSWPPFSRTSSKSMVLSRSEPLRKGTPPSH
jgi:hypothetical protein